MTFIQENIDVFRNTIIVCDRAYHCYDFFMFLMKNKLNFIIRLKGNALNLDHNTMVKKGNKDYSKIIEIRENTRTIRCQDNYEKTIYSGKGKHNYKKLILTI